MLKTIYDGVQMKYVYTLLSKQGFKRTVNEDSAGVYNCQGGLLSIVCDGLGGNKGGAAASKLAMETIYNYFNSSSEWDYLERMRKAFLEANDEVIRVSLADPALSKMATTAEALFIKDDTAYWAHIGDSRIYTLKNEKLKQLTKDHSLVQKMIDEGFLTLKQAEKHPNRNIITRALGDNFEVDVDLSKMKVNNGERTFFLICTDGVTSEITDQEIEDIVINNTDLNTISDRLNTMVEARGASDNFSFVIISK